MRKVPALLTTLLAWAVIVLPITVASQDISEEDAQEMRDAVYHLVTTEQQVFDLQVPGRRTGDDTRRRTNYVRATVRPFQVRQNLCAMRSYVIRRRDSSSDFELQDEGMPETAYWLLKPGQSCDLTDREEVPDIVAVFVDIPIEDLVRIMDGEEELLRAITADVRCDEPVMDYLLETDVQLRLRSVSESPVADDDEYEAHYEEIGRHHGLQVRFSLTPIGFDARWSCNEFWTPMGLVYME